MIVWCFLSGCDSAAPGGLGRIALRLFLFDRGFYVQSVTYPAVPLNGGLLRVQVNANHTNEAIDQLLNTFSDLKTELGRLRSSSSEAV